MPWSSQNGGGGWKSSGGGPWGQKPGGGSGGSGSGGGSGGGDGHNQPDIEDLLKRSQDRLKKAMPGGQRGGFPFGKLPVFLLIIGALAATGFFAFTVRVNTDEQGVVLRFGKFERQLDPGLHLRLPRPFEEVLLPKVTAENRISVGLISGQDRRFGRGVDQDLPAESLMLTGDGNIVDIDFVIFWRIKNAEEYLFNIQRPQLTVKQVAESSMREVVGKSEIQPLMTTERDSTEQAVKKLIQKTLDAYAAGIVVSKVKLTKVDPPAQVVDSFRDVQVAEADRERLENEARSYANEIVPKARGLADKISEAAQAYQEQTVAEATGEASRFAQVYEEYKKAPKITRKRMYLETMERVFSGMDKVIIDSQGGGSGVVPYLPLSELGKKQPAGSAN